MLSRHLSQYTGPSEKHRSNAEFEFFDADERYLEYLLSFRDVLHAGRSFHISACQHVGVDAGNAFRDEDGSASFRVKPL